MVRIIPWNLPPVNGGSVGGYTPAPTPVTPSNDPYDLDNIVLSTAFAEAGHWSSSSWRVTYEKGILTVSNVKILDSTSVGSVIATVHVTSGTNTWNGATAAGPTNEADIDVDISGCMSMLGGSADIANKTGNGVDMIDYMYGEVASNQPYPVFDSSTATMTVTSIKVYNTNGVVIQEWTP